MITPSSRSQAPEPAAPPPRKTWGVGTLTYTSTGLVALFCWLLWGDFAASLKDRSVPAVVQLLLKKFEASDTIAGLLIGSLPAVIGLVFVPIVSYRSDRHRGRWGRRIPYLLVFTPIAALSMVGLAFSPRFGGWLDAALGSHSPGLNDAILIFFGLFWASFEFASIVLAGSLIGALINDVVPRAVLGRFFGLFRALSLIAGMVFNYWLLGKAETHYKWVFLAIGVLYGVGFTVMCLKVKEGDYPPAPPAQPGVAGGFFAAAAAYFRESFTKPYYLWVFAAINLTWMAFVPVNLFGVFFAKSVQMNMDTYGKIWAFTYLISLVMAYVLGSLADRFHPLRVGMVVLALYALATLWSGFFATNAHTFSIALIATGVLSGTWQTATASLPQRLFPQSSFAQYASAMGIVGGVCNVVLPPLVGRFLDLTHHVYRYTHLVSCGIATLALIVSLVLYRKFVTLGGPRSYVAPE